MAWEGGVAYALCLIKKLSFPEQHASSLSLSLSLSFCAKDAAAVTLGMLQQHHWRKDRERRRRGREALKGLRKWSKRRKNDPKMMPRQCQNDAKVTPKWHLWETLFIPYYLQFYWGVPARTCVVVGASAAVGFSSLRVCSYQKLIFFCIVGLFPMYSIGIRRKMVHFIRGYVAI